MSIVEILILAVWLSMDVFAVCMSNGLVYKWLTFMKKSIMVITFWLFHFWMPLIWYFAWWTFMHLISKYDHWVALWLLLFVWWEMIIDFIKGYKQYKKNKWKTELSDKDFTIRTLILQWFAVSVDAIAVWLSFSAMNIWIWTVSVIIALVSMVFCVLWFRIGKKFGLILKHRSQLFGWLVLIWIWIKVFLEHMI